MLSDIRAPVRSCLRLSLLVLHKLQLSWIYVEDPAFERQEEAKECLFRTSQARLQPVKARATSLEQGRRAQYCFEPSIFSAAGPRAFQHFAGLTC